MQNVWDLRLCQASISDIDLGNNLLIQDIPIHRTTSLPIANALTP